MTMTEPRESTRANADCRANVQGISVGSKFEAMNRAIAANRIKPVIDKVFGFDEVQTAYKHMASGAHFGKIVIRVA